MFALGHRTDTFWGITAAVVQFERWFPGLLTLPWTSLSTIDTLSFWVSLDWFKRKSTGTDIIEQSMMPWFPVDFPWNQSNDSGSGEGRLHPQLPRDLSGWGWDLQQQHQRLRSLQAVAQQLLTGSKNIMFDNHASNYSLAINRWHIRFLDRPNNYPFFVGSIPIFFMVCNVFFDGDMFGKTAKMPCKIVNIW